MWSYVDPLSDVICQFASLSLFSVWHGVLKSLNWLWFGAAAAASFVLVHACKVLKAAGRCWISLQHATSAAANQSAFCREGKGIYQGWTKMGPSLSSWSRKVLPAAICTGPAQESYLQEAALLEQGEGIVRPVLPFLLWLAEGFMCLDPFWCRMNGEKLSSSCRHGGTLWWWWYYAVFLAILAAKAGSTLRLVPNTL